jgi:hypothetical protein
MSNIVAVLIVRCTHTGVYADGRPNTASVTLYDLDEITIQKNRERAVPVPPNSFVDIPMSTRTFVSWHEGSICKFTMQGLITSEIILQLRDKTDCGGPAGTGQTLQPAVPNIERVGSVLRLVIPDNVIPTTLDSVGFLVGEPVAITGLTGVFRNLNGEYVISTSSPGTGLAGAAVGSYLIEVPSAGADIASATLAGVNLCLTEGRVTAQFNSNGDVGGLGTNVFGYIGGQLFPNAGGGAGTVAVYDEGVLIDASVSTFDFIGAGVTVTSAGAGAVDVTITGGGGGAPVNAEYLVLTADATLTDERVFTAGTGISVVDGGAGGLFTVSVDATFAEILANGNSTGGTDIVVTTGDSIVGQTDLVLNPGGGGGDNVIIDGLTWPSTDGTSGQALVTDGGGNLSFANPTPALDIQDETVSVETTPTTINFTGAGVTATSGGAGVVNVTIPGGGGSVDLQQAYENGNTIVTDATNGPLDVSGTQAISLDAGAASNFSVASANLTLETTTGGDVLVDSAGSVTVRGDTGVVVTGDIVTDASAVEVFLQGATSSGAGNDGGDVIIVNGNPGVGGTIGDIRIRQTASGSESDRIATLERFGDEAVDLFVGTSDPSGTITGQAASLFFRDTGTTGELYLNTSTGSGTTWSQVVTSASDASAILQWGNNSVGSSTAARVLDPGFEGRLAPLTTGTAFADLRAPRAGTLRNLYIEHNNPGGTGATITYTVYVNGLATAITTGVASTAAGGADTTNTATVAAGDRIRIVVTKAAAAGGGAIVSEATLEVAA